MSSYVSVNTTRKGKTYGVLFIRRGSDNEWYKILDKSDNSHETKRNWRHFQRRRLFPTVIEVRATSAAVDKLMEPAAFLYLFLFTSLSILTTVLTLLFVYFQVNNGLSSLSGLFSRLKWWSYLSLDS